MLLLILVANIGPLLIFGRYNVSVLPLLLWPYHEEHSCCADLPLVAEIGAELHLGDTMLQCCHDFFADMGYLIWHKYSAVVLNWHYFVADMGPELHLHGTIMVQIW